MKPTHQDWLRGLSASEYALANDPGALEYQETHCARCGEPFIGILEEVETSTDRGQRLFVHRRCLHMDEIDFSKDSPEYWRERRDREDDGRLCPACSCTESKPSKFKNVVSCLACRCVYGRTRRDIINLVLWPAHKGMDQTADRPFDLRWYDEGMTYQRLHGWVNKKMEVVQWG